ncbi:hypothetical protein O3P69_003221 [Scylla paramamosain]|uniref:Kinetochore protein NDC80 n=2 Tax=Scylla paramamosain TaxID=85552 RepID=A0AAW0UP25_SCYPA
MRRSASGRVSLQAPGVLKPRNEPFTPNTRESGGQAVRKSYIPKTGPGGSAKRLAGRIGRSSTENVSRLSFASSRFTPTRHNTPACAPQSVNRLSTDSARNSGIGTSTRKETRYVNDPAHKTQCINKIMEFLSSRGKSYQRRTLLTPTTNDFKDIFNFIYQHLDHSYTLPPRFEEEIPKLLKNIDCPFQLTKSSFVTVGSPHTWPVVLAALAFMVDFVHINSIMDSSVPEDDLDDDTTSPVHVCIEAFKCSDDAEEIACLEAHIERIKAENNVSDNDMEELSETIEAKHHELESLPKVIDELKQLKQCNVQYSDDLVKLSTYLQELEVAIQNKVAMEKSIKQSIMELNTEESKISEEINRLKKLKNQQTYSSSELMQLKNHSQEATKEIEYQEQLRNELGNQVRNLELEVSKSESAFRASTVQLENLLEKLNLSKDFSDIDLKSEDVINRHDEIMRILTKLKKEAKKNTSETQEELFRLGQVAERSKWLLQEGLAEGNKLKKKIQHVEEENEVTQEEMKREHQMKLDELEGLHQKIMEARKTQKKPVHDLHQLDDMIIAKKQELEQSKKKEEKCMYDGLQFQKKFFEDQLQHAEVQRKLIVAHTTHINAECTTFLEWLDSLDMD